MVVLKTLCFSAQEKKKKEEKETRAPEASM